MKQKFLLSALMLMALLSGCHNPSWQEPAIKLKNHCWAHWAWYQEKSVYQDGRPRPMYKHFSKGWKQGYAAVANGASTKVPLLPPTEYWAVRFHNPLGRDDIEAWLERYPY